METSMPRSALRAKALLAISAATVALLIASVGASEHPEGSRGEGGVVASPDERVARGSVSYRVHCRNCHGDGGGGDGPMAEVLKVAPADLTRLAHENDGEYPAARIRRAIDGRDEIRGHGPREMPVWGIGFQDMSRDSDQEIEVRDQILDLVAYIESIQVGDRR